MEQIGSAVDAARNAALERWQEERLRNDSAYSHVENVREARYIRLSSRLPADALRDHSEGDGIIHAQAWTHGMDVPASGNRTSIDRGSIEDGFLEHGRPAPPVDVRWLYEHARIPARDEERATEEVAFEALPGAVMSDDRSH